MSCVVEDGQLMDRLFDDCTTLYEAFLRGVRLSGKFVFILTQIFPTEPIIVHLYDYYNY